MMLGARMNKGMRLLVEPLVLGDRGHALLLKVCLQNKVFGGVEPLSACDGVQPVAGVDKKEG
jgi:hypothetical protein